MSRQQYESESDRVNERNVAGLVSSRWNCAFHKLPKAYHLDYAIVRDGVISAWAEVKVRNASYPSYRLALQKWLKAIELLKSTGKKSFLIVSWPVDGERIVMRYEIDPDDVLPIIMAGRTDRNDPDDIEPHVVIPLSKFVRFRASAANTGQVQ